MTSAAPRRHRIAHAIGQGAEYFHVALAVARRFDSPAHALHLPIGVHERSVLFGKGGGRQDDIGELRGPREKDFVNDEEVQGIERLDDARGVRIRRCRVVSDDVGRTHAFARAWCQASVTSVPCR